MFQVQINGLIDLERTPERENRNELKRFEVKGSLEQ
jgi:hypothetical protein